MKYLVFPLLVLLAVPVASARACSCADPLTPQEALAEATAVFSGKVVAAVPVGGNAYQYTIRTYAVWKGSAPDFIELATSDVAMCGLFMGTGSEFLVYAGGEPGQLETTNCSRSKLLELAADDLTELGSPLSVANGDGSITMLKARFD